MIEVTPGRRGAAPIYARVDGTGGVDLTFGKAATFEFSTGDGARTLGEIVTLAEAVARGCLTESIWRHGPRIVRSVGRIHLGEHDAVTTSRRRIWIGRARRTDVTWRPYD